jgi:mannose-6-phosphate isomerase-like protein (cupin superfamily)
MMTGWVGDLAAATEGNAIFRRTLFTGTSLQLTVMCLKPGEEIGVETHEDRDQFLRVESGSATVELGPSRDNLAETHELRDDWAVIVPGGTWHNVTNTGDGDLRLHSLYAPPEHPADTVHHTKADAAAADHH